MENNRAATAEQHLNKIQTRWKHAKAILISCNNTFITRGLVIWGFPISLSWTVDMKNLHAVGFLESYGRKKSAISDRKSTFALQTSFKVHLMTCTTD